MVFLRESERMSERDSDRQTDRWVEMKMEKISLLCLCMYSICMRICVKEGPRGGRAVSTDNIFSTLV